MEYIELHSSSKFEWNKWSSRFILCTCIYTHTHSSIHRIFHPYHMANNEIFMGFLQLQSISERDRHTEMSPYEIAQFTANAIMFELAVNNTVFTFSFDFDWVGVLSCQRYFSQIDFTSVSNTPHPILYAIIYCSAPPPLSARPVSPLYTDWIEYGSLAFRSQAKKFWIERKNHWI